MVVASMNEPLDDARGELLVLADYIENGVYVSLDDLGTRNIALIVAALRAAPARCDAESEHPLGRKTGAFHRALKKYPDAFEALHYFWNEGIAGAVPPPSEAGREEIIEQCAKIADPWPGFNVGQKISEPDISVIAVRTKIAAAIRALSPDQGAVAVTSTQGESP